MMTETATADLCRLKIRAQDRVLDLAIPTDVPLADLLPVILEKAGEDLNEAGLEHGGWVLQRVGDEPFDPEETAVGLQLRDGETLLLLPQRSALPAARLDSLVDAVAESVRTLPYPWTAEASRWVLRFSALAVFLTTGVVLAQSGNADGRATVAMGVGMVTLAGAGAAARAMEDKTGGAMLGLLSSAFLAFAGSLYAAPMRQSLAASASSTQTGVEVVAAAVAGITGAVLAANVVGGFGVIFGSEIFFFLCWAFSGLLMITMDIPFWRASGAAGALALTLGSFVPIVSFSLSGLRLPLLPTNADQLQEGTAPVPAEAVAIRAAETDRWITGFHTAIGLVCLVAEVSMARHPYAPQLLTVVVFAALLVLHSRSLGTAWQRLALLIPAVAGCLALAVVLAGSASALERLALTSLLCFAASVTMILAWVVPGRRFVPHWAHAGDIVQWGCAIALIPVVLWALGVNNYFRLLHG
ncbi:type VII secretion integral membrane protein EccD [Streptomyces sp. NPDC090080]|uniref:type VII secretion integral membrane protein EccD n=1 Tax=Streptomyces sp. NPDC090080 TaxID=3365939 RepID=UPI0037F25498